jgi:hypothetical protein
MPRATWLQTSFNGGEWSPLAHGRVDIAKYKNALAKCLNYVPTAQGGLTRRPGTRFVAEVKDSTKKVRLIPFEFSTTQVYVLEFGDYYIRFYANGNQLLGDDGAPYEVATVYPADDLDTLVFAQSADVLYITHPKHPPCKLMRAGATDWSIVALSFLDGPYLPLNTTPTTLTPTDTHGTVTITASSKNGINNGQGFLPTDVARHLRIKQSGTWLWGKIVSVESPTSITFKYQDAPLRRAVIKPNVSGEAAQAGGSIFSYTVVDGGSGYGAVPPSLTVSWPAVSGSGATRAMAYAQVVGGQVAAVQPSVSGTFYDDTATVEVAPPAYLAANSTSVWRLGVWGTTNSFPAAVVFNQDRLIFAGCPAYPNRIDGSNVSDYENFAPSDVDGTVADDNAVSFTLNANEVDAIRWMISDEWGLLVGTVGGEWVVAPSSQGSVITPTNVQAKMTTSYGCSAVQAVRVAKSTLFVQRTQRKLREMTYQFVISTYQAPDISYVSEHLTKSGIKQLAVARAPQQMLWMCTYDGRLVGVIYDKDQELCGWHGHSLGGYSDAAQTLAPLVESVTCIPDPTTTRDDLWVVVNRFINGRTVRTVERLEKYWEDGDKLQDCVFLDASAEYRDVATTTVSGLKWLVGQTVGVLADGSVHPDCVVDANGAIQLQRQAKIVQVGLKYASQGLTMRIEGGGGDGPGQGKIKRIHRVFMRFFESVGLTLTAGSQGVAGAAPDIQEPFRDSSMPMNQPVDLFTGDKRWSWEGTWTTDGQLSWQQTDPLPSNILLIAAQLETQDGG